MTTPGSELAETEELAEEAPPEEAVTEEVPREEELKPVITIHPPPPFDDEALAPLVDVFMQRRGLTDRKQATIKLANTLMHIGYDPRREIQNVTAYINNLSSVMAGIPDTAETIPLKGSLLARGALESDKLLRKTHFGGEDDMSEYKELIKYAERSKVVMRMLDKIYQGDDMNKREDPRLKRLEEKMDRQDKEREFERLLAPLKTQMDILNAKISELGKRPPTPQVSPEMEEMKKTVNTLVDTLEKQKERDVFTSEMKGLRDDFNKLVDNLGKPGTGAPGNVGDVFDQASTFMDKVIELQKKYPGGEGGELDWKTAMISTFGEIGTEAIKAAKEIMAVEKGGEEPSKVTAEEKEEKISERIMDRKLLKYVQERTVTGAREINTVEVAEKLGVSPNDVLESYQRLIKSGLLKAPGKAGTKSERREEQGAGQWVEG